MAAGRWTVSSVAALAVILLNCILSAHSQTVVDSEFCRNDGKYCPTADNKSYEKYCCAESHGGVAGFNCCNPYLGLYIGVGVGIPIVVVLIIIVVVLYCGCARYQNRKMRALIQAYNTRRERQAEERETGFTDPPPYDPLQSDLPPYTEQDPYQQESSSDQEAVESRGGDSSNSHSGELHNSQSTGLENGVSATEEPTDRSSEVESHNGEEQQVSDSAPLLSEPHSD